MMKSRISRCLSAFMVGAAFLLGNGLNISANEVVKINFFTNENDEDFDDTLIKKLINERNEARKLKNFEKADEIRQNLKNKNIEIEDTKDGTVWTKSK